MIVEIPKRFEEGLTCFVDRTGHFVFDRDLAWRAVLRHVRMA